MKTLAVTPANILEMNGESESIHSYLNSPDFEGVSSDAKSVLMQKIVNRTKQAITFAESNQAQINALNFTAFKASAGDTSIENAVKLLVSKDIVPKELLDIIGQKAQELQIVTERKTYQSIPRVAEKHEVSSKRYFSDTITVFNEGTKQAVFIDKIHALDEDGGFTVIHTSDMVFYADESIESVKRKIHVAKYGENPAGAKTKLSPAMQAIQAKYEHDMDVMGIDPNGASQES